MYRAYIGIGTNLGDKRANLQKALEGISAYSDIRTISSIYETDAFGFESDSSFYNIVIEIHTSHSPLELLQLNQGIEKSMGRVYFNDGQYHSRIIDLDILLYENEILQTEILQIPHPYIQERNFVLMPLLEIAPNIGHPEDKKILFKNYLSESMQSTIKKIENSVLIPC